VLETTALGAAWLAGLGAHVWPDREGFAQSWQRQQRFEPMMNRDVRAGLVTGWRDAVSRTRTSADIR
jgi:glycerol kinase